MDKHELFEQLDAFDPKWQEHYSTLRYAACAARVEDMFFDWLQTSDGRKYRLQQQGVTDWTEVNRRAKAQIDAEREQYLEARRESK